MGLLWVDLIPKRRAGPDSMMLARNWLFPGEGWTCFGIKESASEVGIN